MKNVKFKNIDHKLIENCFLAALEGFHDLHTHQITLIQKTITKTTMRAQPLLNATFFFTSKRDYKIEISNHANLRNYIKVEELPEKVLIGWFAHELGHVQDYLNRSAWGMIKFGLGYSLFPTFQMGAERKADIYAIKAGFAKEILETKKYILSHTSLPSRYKDRIERFYMSPDEVAIYVDKEEKKIKMDHLI